MDLRSILINCRLPGLTSDSSIDRLIDKLDWSAKTHHRLLTGELLPEAKPFSTAGYHALGEARTLYIAGRRDEAIWLLFVSTLMGWERPDSVDRMLRTLADGPRATWQYMVEHGAAAVARVAERGDALMLEAPFGNHRKYETHRGERGSARVIESFRRWAGVSPAARIDAAISCTQGTAHAFDRLYNTFDVYRFGRTARYDLFRLVANFDPRLRPGRCYLSGASGPRRGAALLFLGRSWARDSEIEFLEERCRDLARRCELDPQVIEDAVCQWQKATRSAAVERPSRELARAS
jgi:hypothetical protein